MAYTKGPWEWEDDKLIGANDETVIDIFDVYLRVNPDGNQTLIQSAPDMYEALSFALGGFRAISFMGIDVSEHIKKAEQALAKAEGRRA